MGALTALHFLTASRGNRFMNELLEALAAAALRCGLDAQVRSDEFGPVLEDTAYVLVPHEFFFLVPREPSFTAEHLRRTIGLCVEQPGTQWFEATATTAQHLGASVAIHDSAARALRRRGIPADHLPIGYAPEWDCWGGAPLPRPTDVLYLGGHDDRRAAFLASYASTLAGRRTRLVLAPDLPKPGPGPGFLVGAAKHELLRSSQVLINLHRAGASGLEWLRVVEAIANGCVVVSEHSRDVSPLVPGEHLVSGRARELALLADGLLDDPDRLRRMRIAAYELIRRQLPMESAAQALARVAARLPAQPPAARFDRRRDDLRPGQEAPLPPALGDAVAERLVPVKAALKRLAIDSIAVRRDLAAVVAGVPPGGEPTLVATVSATYVHASPRVSVLVPLHDYEQEVVTALESVAVSTHDSFEVVVLDDASTDGSVRAVEAFMQRTPWLAVALLRSRLNRGLGHSRNDLIEHARGEFVFMLDADNDVQPQALARLEEALGADPQASMAYGLCAVRTDGQPVGLLNLHEWHPARLAVHNYIDAMAMLRRDALVEIGMYATDPRLTGYEDYDLWCRMAARGHRAAYVPQIVATYRRRAHGMLESLTNIDDSVARSLIAARAPQVFASRVRLQDAYAVAAGACES